MIEPTDDNIVRLLATAFMTVMSELAPDDHINKFPEFKAVIAHSIIQVEYYSGTSMEIDVNHLKDVLTKPINKHNTQNSVNQQKE